MQKLKNNQDWLAEIQSAQVSKHLIFSVLGILSWLGFSYLFLLFIKLGQSRSIYDFPWHYDAPIWVFKECLLGAATMLLAKWKFGLLSEKSQSLWRDFVILILLIPLNAVLITSYFNFVLGVGYSGRYAPMNYNLAMGFLSGFITQSFVAMTCIGYFYLSLINQTKERLTAAQQAKTAMELKILQQNVEPHFLFNNLNVLSSLIETDPKTANEFLERLAELYRYILQTQHVEVVLIKQELAFAESYCYLIEQRFGSAYYFDWQVAEYKLNGQMIVPSALQSLIENAVKHNAGDQKEPLQICIKLDADSLSVENDLRKRSKMYAGSGTGLQNLTARYAFLTDQPMKIESDEHTFKVTLPLLKMDKSAKMETSYESYIP